MEIKLFLGQYLICVILLLGQLHGCKSCIEKEREALLELKNYMISRSLEGTSHYFLTTWTNDPKTDCCRWEGIECSRTSGRVIGLSVGFMEFKEDSLLNLSLLYPFEEIRSLSLSSGQQYREYDYHNQFTGFFDDVKGYKSLSTLRNLEILDLSSNMFNNSIFPFLNAATSLTTLVLRANIMEGPFPYKVTRKKQKSLSVSPKSKSETENFSSNRKRRTQFDRGGCRSSSLEIGRVLMRNVICQVMYKGEDGDVPSGGNYSSESSQSLVSDSNTVRETIDTVPEFEQPGQENLFGMYVDDLMFPMNEQEVLSLWDVLDPDMLISVTTTSLLYSHKLLT